ncbi:MAG: hypothetical protein OXI01_14465 [Albidovulum sp.]|nr:hypothetical protein [Albidovulum sp.]
MNRTGPGNEPAPSMQMIADRQPKRPPGRDAGSPGNGGSSLAAIEVKLDSLRTDLAAEIRSVRKDVGSLENRMRSSEETNPLT